MTNLKNIRKVDLSQAQSDSARELLRREWLITNGLGGYASGTVSGVVSRRYHGLLVAALPAPLGRVVMLNHLTETIRLPDGQRAQIGGKSRATRKTQRRQCGISCASSGWRPGCPRGVSRSMVSSSKNASFFCMGRIRST